MHFSSSHSALIYLLVECSQWLSINTKLWKKRSFFDRISNTYVEFQTDFYSYFHVYAIFCQFHRKLAIECKQLASVPIICCPFFRSWMHYISLVLFFTFFHLFFLASRRFYCCLRFNRSPVCSICFACVGLFVVLSTWACTRLTY